MNELNEELNHLKSCLMHEVMEGTLNLHKTARYLNEIENLIKEKEQKRMELKFDDLLEVVTTLANENHDGHFTLMKFTTNWSACFGTPNTRFEVERMTKGKTKEEALFNLLKNPKDIYQITKEESSC